MTAVVSLYYQKNFTDGGPVVSQKYANTMNNPPTLSHSTDSLSATPSAKRGGGCLKGCLVLSIVLITACAVAAYFITSSAGAFLRQRSSAALDRLSREILSRAPLSAPEKIKLESIVNQLNADLRAGKVSLSQGLKIAEQLTHGSFMPQFMSLSFKEHYLKNSGLTDTEKTAAIAVIQQFTAGIAQNRISKQQSDSILRLFSDPSSSGGKNLISIKPTLSDTEIRAAISQMKNAALAAGASSAVPGSGLSAEPNRAIEAGMRAPQ